MSPSTIELAATIIFAIAVLHTFSTSYFEHLAKAHLNHAGVWHLLGEVEAVFGFWALILILFMIFTAGHGEALHYFEGRNFTEPSFVFVIMVIAASRPIIDFAGALLLWSSRLLPLPRTIAYYFVVLSIGPLLGSFITEPAAMTLSALLLKQRFLSREAPTAFKYATLGVLFVNVSIGGTLTPFAAPPVLMVAERWGFDIGFMLTTFGWKAAVAVCFNAAAVAFLFRGYLLKVSTLSAALAGLEVPVWVIAIHLMFLTTVVVFVHHPFVFIAAFLFFLGFTEAYRQYQSRLLLREGLMVGFFLAGLVVLGGLQKWWLQPVLSGMPPQVLYWGASALTAITDNAALTYLGSLVEGVDDAFKYALVAGSVTGGGMTVIANAPNPAGFAILKSSFDDNTISALWLATAALLPTLVAAAAFLLLP